RDLQVRQGGLRVERLDRRIVPVRDLAHVDLRDHVAGEVQVRVLGKLETGEVVRDRGACERPRDLDAAVARVELIGRERSVGGAEVDGARGYCRDARARANRAVLNRV